MSRGTPAFRRSDIFFTTSRKCCAATRKLSAVALRLLQFSSSVVVDFWMSSATSPSVHDLESFFWVLFWICIHYSGPGEAIGPTEYESWNYESNEKLIASKIGEIADEEVFLKKAGENFTLHYRPLILWVNRLQREVFPNGGRWKKLEPELYSSMKKILYDALKDLEVFQIA
ncbi:hypothetical protein VTK26DRAFT_4043 [Humicola hyalothermophila]